MLPRETLQHARTHVRPSMKKETQQYGSDHVMDSHVGGGVFPGCGASVVTITAARRRKGVSRTGAVQWLESIISFYFTAFGDGAALISDSVVRDEAPGPARSVVGIAAEVLEASHGIHVLTMIRRRSAVLMRMRSLLVPSAANGPAPTQSRWVGRCVPISTHAWQVLSDTVVNLVPV